MLITNWLSALVTRIRHRPRYNSRTRRSIRKRWQAIQQNKITTVDVLEAREMLTSLSITDVDLVEDDSGTQTLYFYANLSAAVGANVTFDVSTSDVTASAADGDYEALSSQTFTIIAGETSAAIAIDVYGDTKVELDETFQVTLSDLNEGGQGVTFAGSGATESAIGTITNDDSFVKIIKTEDTETRIVGNWGESGSSRYHLGGSGLNRISWDFSDVGAGTYRLSANWSTNSNRASNAEYQISGVSDGEVTTYLNQKTLSQDVYDAGVYWEDLGYFEVEANGTITVTLSDNGADGYVFADGMRLEAVPAGVSLPEIRVTESTNDVLSGSSTVAWGDVLYGRSVVKTFTIENLGTADLDLSGGVSLTGGNGFTIVSPPASSLLAAGESTTFDVEFLSTAEVGTYSDTVSISTNDSDESPFTFTVSADQVMSAVLEETDPSSSTIGMWSTTSGNKYIAGGGSGANTVSWSFSDLGAGTYRLSANWHTHTSRATNAQHTISGVNGGDVVRYVNQKTLSQDVYDAGVYWEDLGYFEVDANGTITVTVSDIDANNYVMANMMRLEAVPAGVSLPEIKVTESTNDVLSGSSTVAWGDVLYGRSVVKTFTIENLGTADLDLSGGVSLTGGNGFTIVSPPASSLLAAGESTTFAVEFLSSSTAGAYSDTVSISTNDSDESPFTFTVSADQVMSAVLEETGPSSSTIGMWSTTSGNKYIAGGGSGANTVSWSFSDLGAGTYRLSANWHTHTSRATNAQHTVSGVNGGDVVRYVNQKTLSQDVYDAGVYWEDLGYFEVDANGTITVTVSDIDANNYVMANMMRLEAVPAGVSLPEIKVTESTNDVLSGSSTVAWGDVLYGRSVVKTFTIENLGTADLDLSGGVSLTGGNGFTIMSPPASSLLAAGESTTFAVEFLSSSTAGAYSDTVSISTNDSDESPFTFTVSADQVMSAVLEETGPSSSTIGMWSTTSGNKYIAGGGSGANTVSWSFSDLGAGTYRLSSNWSTSSNRASNAQHTISGVTGGDVVRYVNQKTLSQDVYDAGVYWEDLGYFEVDANGTITVTVSDIDANNYVMANMMRLEAVPAGVSLPEIKVTESTNDVLSGSSTVAWGDVLYGRSVVKTFTIENLGTADLDLSGGVSLTGGNGFTIVSPPASSLLAAGESTTFAVEFSSTQGTGDYEALIVINNNDSDEHAFRISLSASLVLQEIIDNADAKFNLSGTWLDSTSGLNADGKYVSGGTGSNTSSWTFQNLHAGTYRLSGTWTVDVSHATNSQFTVSGVTGGDVVQYLDQQGLTQDVYDAGVYWQDLGDFEVDANGTITVTLSDDGANGYVFADAMRLEAIPAGVTSSEIKVSQSSTELNSGNSTVAWGDALYGRSHVRTFTITNLGTGNLDLSGGVSVTGGNGFTISSQPAVSVLSAGESTTFDVEFLSTAEVGTYSDTVSVSTNDSDESPFTFTVSADLTLSTIVDNGDPGFEITGNWNSAGEGYGNDSYYRSGGLEGENNAIWEFSGLAAGTYRLSSTWNTYYNRTSSAAFTMSGVNGGDVTTYLDQRTLIVDVTDAGRNWEDLGYFEVDANGTITVTLSGNDTDGTVFVDAIRLEAVPAGATAAEIKLTDPAKPTTGIAVNSTIAWGDALYGRSHVRTFTIRIWVR
ncbi:choice-of-anchor D domain-containing protein [Gimesia maris]|uniref:golvesin C-terminal-like domain-containing protein n=1 Tax=Gimesia maris TaxID=122 RepID=UPI0001544192|nr:choice-of-anchor D domain-containing protein [Gimesia maris]EDL56158.1 Outer membrane autotransporter barrel [Gimesia maris DSM 8797]